MLRELTSLSLNINNDTLILSSVSEADPVTGGPAYKLSPSLPLGSCIWTMGELVITLGPKGGIGVLGYPCLHTDTLLSVWLSQLAMGCVTCHACHGCVTDFRPILGNPVEVTHVTSLGHVYIFPC